MQKINKNYLTILLILIAFITTGCFNKKTENTEIVNTEEAQSMDEKKVEVSDKQDDKIIKRKKKNKSDITLIGFIGPLSGEKEIYGKQIQSILDYSIQQINEVAQTKEKRFDVIYEDGKCTDVGAIQAFKKLVENNVEFIIGGVCPEETLAIAQLAEANKVLVITPASSNSKINGLSSFTYSLSYQDDVIGKTLAHEMSKYKYIGIISEQTDFNLKVQKDLVAAIKKYPNSQVVGRETFPKGVPEVRESLERLKGSGPNAILLNPDAGKTADNLLKQLSEVPDWSGYKLFSTAVYKKGDGLKTYPELTNGLVMVDMPKITNENLLATKKEIEAAKGPLDSVGEYYTASTLDTINIITDLVLELGDNAQRVQQALISRNFDGYIGSNINFKNSNFPEINGTIYEVKNGEITEK